MLNASFLCVIALYILGLYDRCIIIGELMSEQHFNVDGWGGANFSTTS